MTVRDTKRSIGSSNRNFYAFTLILILATIACFCCSSVLLKQLINRCFPLAYGRSRGGLFRPLLDDDGSDTENGNESDEDPHTVYWNHLENVGRDGWRCPCCKFQNGPKRRLCMLCNMAKPSLGDGGKATFSLKRGGTTMMTNSEEAQRGSVQEEIRVVVVRDEYPDEDASTRDDTGTRSDSLDYFTDPHIDLEDALRTPKQKWAFLRRCWELKLTDEEGQQLIWIFQEPASPFPRCIRDMEWMPFTSRRDEDQKAYVDDTKRELTFHPYESLDLAPILSSRVTRTLWQYAFVSKYDLRNISMLPYWRKHMWLLDQQSTIQIPWSEGHILIEIHRDRILEESFEQFMTIVGRDLHLWMRIQFVDEPGVDAGGLEREWFVLVLQALLDPSFGLFRRKDGEDGIPVHVINPWSRWTCSDDHLKYFVFIGRLLGKALMEHQLIPFQLCKVLLKHIARRPVGRCDFAHEDPEMFRNLMTLLRRASPESLRELQLDFSVSHVINGEDIVLELIPNGKGRAVTMDNLRDYVCAKMDFYVMNGIKDQLLHLLLGFGEVIPADLLVVFDECELGLLFGGVPTVDMEDWKRHTHYHGDYHRLGEKHVVIQWFWECIAKMSDGERSRFLQFCTGNAQVPAHGFQALQSNDGLFREFSIHSISKSESIYPRAHTCFNKIDLPLYSSREEMERFLMEVIYMEITGFSMG